MKKTNKTSWADTADGASKYNAARAQAQAAANADGFDRGIERNDVFKSFSVFMLPQRQNRCGFEMRCEVVMCEDMSKCQKGHGAR